MGNFGSKETQEPPEITLPDGSKYRGGRYEFASGNVYDGSAKVGRFDGLGIFLWKSGSRYEGEFVANQCCGLGACWNQDGKLFRCGRWVNNKFEDFVAVPLSRIPDGKYLSAAAKRAKRDHPNESALMPDGTHYIGPLNKQGQPHGQGATFHPDGSPYVTLLIDADASNNGRFVDGNVQGRAKQLFSDGDCYEGMFKDSRFHGLGIYGWKDVGRYEGEWVVGKRSGLGACWDKEGKLVECGRWADDKLEETLAVPLACIPDGKLLSAAAKQAKHDHPKNSALLPSGSHYIGELNKQGQPHGQGASFHPDGSPAVTLLIDEFGVSKSGRWDDGKVQGQATCIIGVDGHHYDGAFKDSLFDGIGVFSWPGGKRYEGEFARGDFSGLGARWVQDGKLIKCGRWANDMLVESCAVPLRSLPERKYLGAAALQANREHPNDSALMPDGAHFVGSLNKRGQPHGQGASFHPDGSPDVTLLADPANVSKSGRWVDGKVQGRATWIRVDGHHYVGAFKDSQCDGIGVYLWPDGRRYEGEYAAGKRCGLGAEWDKDGKLVGCGRWRADKCVLSCPVPMRCIPDGKHLSATANAARQSHPDTTLLLLSGGHYTGAFDAITFRLHGAGVEFDASGTEIRRGEWREGSFHSGSGLLLSADGQSQYVGSVRNGLRHGPGQLTSLLTCTVIEAEWVNGLAAAGAYLAADGSRFEGELQLNRPHGLGVRWSTLGVMLECGEFFEGALRRSCVIRCSQLPFRKFVPPNATLMYPDHRYYCGEINEANQRHGQGTLFSESGSEESSGEWFEDRLHGEGRCAWTKGRSYRGQFVFGALTGLGQLHYPNGDLFEGEFVKGKKVGFGVRWDAHGKVIECGVFRRVLGREWVTTGPVPRSKLLYGERLNELARTASLLFPDGSFFVGPLNSQLQPHGVGKCYNASGVLTEAGLWRAGAIKQSAMVALRSATVKGGRRMALVIANTNYLGDGTKAESESSSGDSTETEPASPPCDRAESESASPPGDGADSAGFYSPLLPTVKPALGGTEDSGRSMVDCLIDLGFDSVESLFDGTLEQMRVNIRALIDSLKTGDVVFLYFIGHGALVNGTTYLSPVDLCGAAMTDFAISVKHIRQQISSSANCRNLTVVMALDCCRVELDEAASCSEDDEEGLPRGLQLQHEVSRSASASCASSVASAFSPSRESRKQRAVRLGNASIRAGNEYFIMHANESALSARTLGGLGAFTRELLRLLPQRIEITEMFRELSASLRKSTIHSQHPQQATQEGSLSRKQFLAGEKRMDARSRPNTAAAQAKQGKQRT